VQTLAKKHNFVLISLTLLGFLLWGCRAQSTAESQIKSATQSTTPLFPEVVTSTATIAPTEEISQLRYWISSDLPDGVLDALTFPEDAIESKNVDEADIVIEIGMEEEILGRWIYALVAPFPTLVDEVTSEDVTRAWDGDSVTAFEDAPLLMSPDTKAALSAIWGAPSKGAVRLLGADGLLDEAWDLQPAWAIVPFEELSPRWKVLAVDGQSPIWKDFDLGNYPLTIPIGISGEVVLDAISNRDESKLTTVITTGVTALVRATAWEMERKGLTYAAEVIGDLLRGADITHVSNEVPFTEDCPPPNPSQRNLIFCSDASYIALLEEIGTDVVELTGDHFNDWTKEAMLFTLELYKERGWPYYGGGANIEEGLRALQLEHNGNLIAFIGCNGKGGRYASAAVDYPGAVKCDYEYLEEEIARLSEVGYVVIVTFQHDEVYTYKPQPGLKRDFTRVAVAGASIVSGSQAHQAHGVQFADEDSLIMYGLGNLFFDQIVISQDTSQALIGRHVIYDGRYISTEIFTTIFVDYAKSIFMSEEERNEYLAIIFKNSIWEFADSEGSEDGT
jgi:hypothetical protein